MRKIHFHLFVCSLAKILIVGGRSRGRPSTGGLLMVSPGSDEWSANKAELSGCPQNKCYSVKEKQCQLNDECYDLNCHGAAVEFKFKELASLSMSGIGRNQGILISSLLPFLICLANFLVEVFIFSFKNFQDSFLFLVNKREIKH